MEIRVDGLIWVRPGLSADEIQKTFYNIDNWKIAVLQLAKTNLRQEFGELTLDESLTADLFPAFAFRPHQFFFHLQLGGDPGVV